MGDLMPRTRDFAEHDATKEQIKQIAREHMAQEGTAAISLRAIARAMNVSAPALYRYFSSLDELITALILDAFNALADALELADKGVSQDDYYTRMLTVLLRYRTWALEHPIDFQLIYGNPIPGFHAPPEITVPAVQRGFVVIVTILVEAMFVGEAQPAPEFNDVPPRVADALNEIIEKGGFPITTQMLYLGIVSWTRVHGVIMLELFNHLGPTVGVSEDYYRAEVDQLLKGMGLKPKRN
jgi:AcrR family transcriptional regulator